MKSIKNFSAWVLIPILAGVSLLHAKDKPNVVLLVCDDLNTSIGHLGGHPQVKTPHIDRLAASGVSFKRAYSNNPVCAPSRSSFLTGILPHTSGNLFWNEWFKNPVLANSNTLMEHFRANGYMVVGSGKLMHHFRAGDWDEFPHKVDYGPIAWNGSERVGHPSVPEPFRGIGPVDGSFAPLSDVPYGGKNGAGWIYGTRAKTKRMRYVSEDDRDPTPDERNAAWAAARIERFAKEQTRQPFFLSVGFIRPHTPMYAPKKYFDMYPTATLQLPPIRKDDAEDTHYRDVFKDDVKGLRYFSTLSKSYPNPEDGLKAFFQAYLACVTAVDEQIGVVINAIDKSPFKDNTIIIVTSDHGWNNGEKDYLFKNSPWEESTRIPFVVRAPGVARPGGMAEHPISLIDLYPTLVDLCGLPRKTQKNSKGRQLDGHSIRPFLTDPESRKWDGPDHALTMVFAGEDSKTEMTKDDLTRAANQHFSVRTERWRYIRYNNGMEELYDHQSDPHEWTNLAKDPRQIETLGQLRARLPAMVHGSDRTE